MKLLAYHVKAAKQPNPQEYKNTRCVTIDNVPYNIGGDHSDKRPEDPTEELESALTGGSDVKSSASSQESVLLEHSLAKPINVVPKNLRAGSHSIVVAMLVLWEVVPVH